MRMSSPASKGGKRIGRLRRRSDFLCAAEKGAKWVSPTVIVQARANGLAENRVGLTTTKKLGGAVIRNRIRRRLKEAAREAVPGGEVAGFDLVFIGRSETLACPHATLVRDLGWCLKRLGVTAPPKTASMPEQTA